MQNGWIDRVFDLSVRTVDPVGFNSCRRAPIPLGPYRLAVAHLPIIAEKTRDSLRQLETSPKSDSKSSGARLLCRLLHPKLTLIAPLVQPVHDLLPCPQNRRSGQRSGRGNRLPRPPPREI